MFSQRWKWIAVIGGTVVLSTTLCSAATPAELTSLRLKSQPEQAVFGEAEPVFTPPPPEAGMSLPTVEPVPMQSVPLQFPTLTPYQESYEEPWTWHVLPDGLVYKSYLAGEREPRLSTAFLHESGGEWLWDSALGGRASILRYGTSGSVQPQGWELQVEGAAFVRLLPEEDRDVNAVDFRAGVPLAYRNGPFQYKFGYYHISSHLGDEFLLKRPGYDRLNYSRDSLVLGMGYFPTDNLRLYAEVGWAVIYTSGGAEPWEFQTGLEWQTQEPTGIRGAPYFAMNIHLREEVDWGGNINILAGWMWRGYHADHTFRLGLQYFNGKNAQFSLLQDNQQLLGWGIRYDF
ncbi:DUF1207 domain-containing protein [bacterium]|nr:DUF1207 domain-containing protein [bacterium]